MEAAGLAFFMISACAFTTLLEHPESVVRQLLPNVAVRRILTGLAMGLTAISIIYSPWGQRSGAHLNPAITLSFYRLNKIAAPDAAFYVLFQFAGGVAGVALSAALLGSLLADPSVHYATTLPGPSGPGTAFLAEAFISFLMFSVVLIASNAENLARYTGLFAGALVASFIAIESPLSGMSMNPARTLGSAVPAGLWTALWVYFTAPPLGMLLAAEAYSRARGSRGVLCAKLHHHNSKRCIYRCGYAMS